MKAKGGWGGQKHLCDEQRSCQMSVREEQLISCCSPWGITMLLNSHPNSTTHNATLSAGTHTQTTFCSRMSSTMGASSGQAYYSFSEVVVSLLTGRHKYFSTLLPRVNGCPSNSYSTYGAVWPHAETFGIVTFIEIPRSLMRMGKVQGRRASTGGKKHSICEAVKRFML